jgi:hypothetical protein
MYNVSCDVRYRKNKSPLHFYMGVIKVTKLFTALTKVNAISMPSTSLHRVILLDRRLGKTRVLYGEYNSASSG